MSNQSNNTEQRQFNRIAFDAPVSIKNEDTEHKSSLIDISLKGVLLKKPNSWYHNNQDEFNITVKLDDHESEINMHVMQAHEEPEQLGFKCIDIDIDSMTVLKRLVELNLGDESLLNREISNMIAA